MVVIAAFFFLKKSATIFCRDTVVAGKNASPSPKTLLEVGSVLKTLQVHKRHFRDFLWTSTTKNAYKTCMIISLLVLLSLQNPKRQGDISLIDPILLPEPIFLAWKVERVRACRALILELYKHLVQTVQQPNK